MPLSLGAEMWGPAAWLLLLLLLASFTGQRLAGELETSDLVTVVLGQDAKLPCFYRGDPGEQVEQVAWARVDAGEGGRELALLNSKYGLHVSSAYEGRVEQPPPPRNPLDGAVLLRNAVQADEGEYECRVSTFPAGSFQARLRLRVLVPPLPSLNPGPPLEEGQGLTLAASCTAEGSPAPSVTWDTEVKGTASHRSFTHSRSAAVTSEFHLVPSRSMNGQPLTCVVSHPGLLQDQRITHILQVAFLAEASVRGLEDRKLWQVGREGAMLKCLSEGQPPPSYNWTRLDGPLPSGVRAEGDTLGFPTLTPEHSGTYVCRVSNALSSRDSQVVVDVLGKHGGKGWDLGQGPGGVNGKQDRVNWESVYLEGSGLCVFLRGQAEGVVWDVSRADRVGRAGDLDVCLRARPAPSRPRGRPREAGGPRVGLRGGGGRDRRALVLPSRGGRGAHVPIPSAQGPADDPEIVSTGPSRAGEVSGEQRGDKQEVGQD
uniref:Nectin cell adhesion molecule 4 n=1 Tax=Bos taurus TaxID=9913 RepID=A0AAA9TP94_BOVIN